MAAPKGATPAQIINHLRKAGVGLADGKSMREVCRRTADCARVPELLDQIDDRVATFMADAAYDAGAVYEAAEEKGDGQRVTVLIPPGRGTQLAPACGEGHLGERGIRAMHQRPYNPPDLPCHSIIEER